MYGEAIPPPIFKVPGMDARLARYRQQDPAPGEVERMAIAGFLVGEEGRRDPNKHQNMVLIGAVVLGAVGIGLSAVTAFPMWAAIVAMVLVVGVGTLLSIRTSLSGRSRRYVAVFLSDQRFLVVEPIGNDGDAALVLQHRPEDVDRVSIAPIPSRWVANDLMVRVAFAGWRGPAAAIDVMLQDDPVGLRTELARAGLHVEDTFAGR